MKNYYQHQQAVLEAYLNSVFPTLFFENFDAKKFAEEHELDTDNVISALEEIKDESFLKEYVAGTEAYSSLTVDDLDPDCKMQNVSAKIFKLSNNFFYCLIDTLDSEHVEIFTRSDDAQKWLTNTLYGEIESYNESY